MKNIQELFTPCLIVDESKISKNIQRIKSLVSKRNVNFRPHLETIKSKEITKMFINEFGSSAMVSTIEEIEITDFLYSVAIVPNKLDRIAKSLSKNCNITVSVDHILMAKELVNFYKKTGVKITAVIELDFDGHRSDIRSMPIKV